MNYKLNYRMVNNHVAEMLSLSETYTYLMLALKSDYNTFESHINQSTLGELVGLKTDQVREHLDKMKELGIIRKTRDEFYIDTQGRKKCKYKLLYDINPYHNTPEHWVYIDIGLLDKEPISKELKAFLVKLKICCFNYTNICQYSGRQLGDEEMNLVNMRKSSVDKYLKEAESLGYIKREIQKGVKQIRLLDEKIFIRPKETDIAVMKGVYPEALDEDDYDERGHSKHKPIL